MKADPSKYSVSQALSACDQIIAHVDAPNNPYNFSSGDLSSLQGIRDALEVTAAAQIDAFHNLKAKTQTKDENLHGVARTLSRLTRIAMASNASPTELKEIGMQRPAKPVRPTAIPAPMDLVASGLPDARTKIAFDRNGNPQGTTFEVFWSATGEDYEMVATTTRAGLVLEAQAPGVAAWFKVRAKRSGLVSPFSNDASIYAPAAPSRPALRVA